MTQTEAVVSYFEVPVRSLSNNHSSLGFNHLNAELNPICHFLALLGAHHILHVSRVRVNIGPTEYSAISVPTGQQRPYSTTVSAHHSWFGSKLAK